MQVNPYIVPLLANAVDLLNDPVTTASDLDQRWAARQMPSAAAATEADVEEVTAFVQRFAAVVDAGTEQARVDALNALLARYATAPSITNHDGSRWHLHHRPPDAGFAAMLAGATVAAAAHYLTERGMHRIGRCAHVDCARAFVDVSRPGTQKYCRHACANRDAVRRHRAAAR